MHSLNEQFQFKIDVKKCALSDVRVSFVDYKVASWAILRAIVILRSWNIKAYIIYLIRVSYAYDSATAEQSAAWRRVQQLIDS